MKLRTSICDCPITRYVSIAILVVIAASLFGTAALASETRELIIRPGQCDPRAIFCVIVFILSYLYAREVV